MRFYARAVINNQRDAVVSVSGNRRKILSLVSRLQEAERNFHEDVMPNIQQNAVCIRNSVPLISCFRWAIADNSLGIVRSSDFLAFVWVSIFFVASSGSLRESFDISVVQPPNRVAIEGKEQLVYEVHVTNFSRDRSQLLSLRVVDGDHGNALATFAGPALANRTHLVGLQAPDNTAESISLSPGQRAVLYVELDCQADQIPRVLVHEIEYSVANESATHVVAGGRTSVEDTAPVALGPPVRGGEWVAVHHPDWARGHRRVLYTLDGRARIPGRFAIDFFKVNESGETATGDSDIVNNWLGYGTPVLAVADSKVVAVRQDIAEPRRVSENRKPPIEDAAGDYIVLKLDEHRFAFYEHLKPGSIQVKVGENVSRGQVIAALGFTGESTSPHLHFHVADGPTPLGAEGMPFTFDGFALLGHYANIGELGSARWESLKTGLPTARVDEMPSSNAVIRF